jgi:hypothetical protein
MCSHPPYSPDLVSLIFTTLCGWRASSKLQWGLSDFEDLVAECCVVASINASNNSRSVYLLDGDILKSAIFKDFLMVKIQDMMSVSEFFKLKFSIC